MQGFVLHKQPAAAEKVLGLMQRRGLKPSTVTWNSIINAYALVQDVRGLMDAMMKREKSGFGVDKYTRRALKRFENKEELVKMLNKENRKGGNELAGKMSIAASQQPQSMTTEEAKSFMGERNNHPFRNSHEPHNNDESAVLNSMYRYSTAQGHELPFPTYPSMS